MSGHDATRGDVTIGHDVWLGSQAMIMSGVTIGHGAVVAARAVVTRDVPPYAIVAGNPARAMRLRLPEAQVEALLASRWWELPPERISALLPLLMSDRVDELMAAVRPASAGGA
jgi:carbonic anhydrase/acetyltransferase-like protein (isoleucine patch superfamily)